MANPLIERIESRLAELNLKPRAASLKVSTNADLIRGVLRAGDSANPTRDTLERIAEALDVSVEWLIGGGADQTSNVVPLTSRQTTLGPAVARSGMVPDFAGFAQAGNWAAVDEYFQQDNYPVPEFVLRHPAFPKVRQYAYQVRGDSMNERGIEDGMWVVAADALEFIDTYRDTESGDLVVVERTRYQGAERELTIKEVHFFRDRMELRPRSRNSEHQPIIVPLNPAGDDGIEVKLVGVVLTAYQDFMRRR